MAKDMGEKFHEYYLFALNNGLTWWDKSWLLDVYAETAYGIYSEVSTFDNIEYKNTGCPVTFICFYLNGIEIRNKKWVKKAIGLYIPKFTEEKYQILSVNAYFNGNKILDLDKVNKDVVSEMIRVYLSQKLNEEELETAMNDLGEHGMILKPKFHYED